MRVIGRKAWITLTGGVHVKETDAGTYLVDGMWLSASRGRIAQPSLVMAVGPQRMGEPDERGWRTATREVVVARIGRRGRRHPDFERIPFFEAGGTVMTLDVGLGHPHAEPRTRRGRRRDRAYRSPWLAG